MNEYFRFDFELNHFWARFNVWMNDQNKLNSVWGGQRGKVLREVFILVFGNPSLTLSYSTVLTGFQSMFENYTILNCCVALDSKNVSKLKLKCFLGPGDTNRQKQLKNQKKIIRFGHTKGLLFKKRTTFWPKFPSWGIWPIYMHIFIIYKQDDIALTSHLFTLCWLGFTFPVPGKRGGHLSLRLTFVK